jgi:hypothetical protein
MVRLVRAGAWVIEKRWREFSGKEGAGLQSAYQFLSVSSFGEGVRQ